MSYRMRITEIATGESIVSEEAGAYSEYHWTEGNMGCDCNRLLRVLLAKGVPEVEAWETSRPCSEGKYTAEFIDGDSEPEDVPAPAPHIIEVATDIARKEAHRIEAELMRLVGTGVDLAVIRDMVCGADGVKVRLGFVPVRPGEQPPPNCTLYRLTGLGRGGHA